MGVRGLQGFLCGDPKGRFSGLPNGVNKIDMREKIQRWKRINGTTPILVVDAMGIISLKKKNESELFCGGRHQQYYELFGNLFNELTSCGAKLVFFSDSTVQETKSDLWLMRRDEEYTDICNIFDSIASGYSVPQILRNLRGGPRALTTASAHTLASEAKRYGKYYHSTKHDCDAELAKYARDHNALAVIGNDSDFLIFMGDWEYWSAHDIDVDALTTLEYNRQTLQQRLALSYEQMPLLATLMSNDHTKSVTDQLYSFQRRLGQLSEKWMNMANYVRGTCHSAFGLSEADIAQISKRVFGYSDSMETRKMIHNGVQSYNMDFSVEKDTDPLLQKAVHHSNLYKVLTIPIITLTITMFDMRLVSSATSYTAIMAELSQKIAGVLWKQRNPKYTFKLFAKWSHSEKFSSKTTKPIFPPNNLELPPLIDMLFKDDPDIDSEFNSTRWNLLLWLLSIEPKFRKRIQSVPIAFRLIATTLLYMVQQSQINESEANTILIAEAKVAKDDVAEYTCPQYRKARFVHVAHLYCKIYQKIRLAFEVVGLREFINSSLKFDGVCFYGLSTELAMIPTALDQYSVEIKPQQIYID